MPKQTAKKGRARHGSDSPYPDRSARAVKSRTLKETPDEQLQRIRRAEVKQMRAVVAVQRTVEKLARQVRRSFTRSDRAQADLLHALAARFQMHVQPRSETQLRAEELARLHAALDDARLELEQLRAAQAAEEEATAEVMRQELGVGALAAGTQAL